MVRALFPVVIVLVLEKSGSDKPQKPDFSCRLKSKSRIVRTAQGREFGKEYAAHVVKGEEQAAQVTQVVFQC